MSKLKAILLIFIVSLFTTFSARAERVILGFRNRPDRTMIKSIQLLGGRVHHTYRIINALAIEGNKASLERIRKSIRPFYIEEDAIVTIDEAQVTPWGITKVKAPLSYNKGTSVRVAIVDSGIDYTHPDLADNYMGGYNFISFIPSDPLDPMDANGHGTHCAGVVAAIDNDKGVIGVAPEASLYAVKVISASGSGIISDLIAGIEWCIFNNMQVISMSLGTDANSSALHEICNAAYAANIAVVAAAGNSATGKEGEDTVRYPAKYDSVVAVAAININEKKPSWSSVGPAVEIAAPGVNVLSTNKGGDYSNLDGTSMACPHVAGVMALAKLEGLSVTEIRRRLANTAKDLGEEGKDPFFGYGLVNASGVCPKPPPEDELPYVVIISPEDNSVVSGICRIQADAIDDTEVINVSFRINGKKVYSATTTSYIYDWNTIKYFGEATIQVVAIDNKGQQGEDSITVIVENNLPTPGKVTGLEVKALNSNEIQLSWNPVDTATIYNIYRSKQITGPYQLVSFAMFETYIDSRLAENTIYYYMVSAVNDLEVEGEKSDIAECRTLPFTTYKDVEVESLDVWSERSGFRSYDIYIKVKVASEDDSVENALVIVTMTLPDESQIEIANTTDSKGKVIIDYGPFKGIGTYIIEVTDILIEGYRFKKTGNEEYIFEKKRFQR